MALRSRCTALLIDLDGVLRTWDPAWMAGVEARRGLPAGSLAEVAFARVRRQPAIVGAVTHEEWMAGVTAELAERGYAEAEAAVADWQTYCGEVDAEVLDFVRTVRAGGLPVAIVTNATTRLRADLDALGLTDEVDAVVSSAEVGFHKPTKEYFAAACAAVDRPAAECLFVDDDERNCRGARVAGLAAYPYTPPANFGYLTAALSLVA